MSKPPIFKPVGQNSRKQPGGPTFRWAILTFLLLHGLFFTGLLLQGCRPKTEVANEPLPTNNAPFLEGLWHVDSSTPEEPASPPVAAETAPAPPAATETAPPSPPPTAPPAPPPATNPVVAVESPPPATPAPPPIQTNVTEAASAPAPAPGTTPEESQNLAQAQEYVVQAGDTFWGIARKFGITVQQLQDANPGKKPTALQIGAPLIIPPPAPQPPPVEETYDGTIYLIKKGDTLSKIARKFGVTIEAIRKENRLKSYTIYAGQKLKIPAAPAPKP